jgi:hypothetical protein
MAPSAGPPRGCLVVLTLGAMLLWLLSDPVAASSNRSSSAAFTHVAGFRAGHLLWKVPPTSRAGKGVDYRLCSFCASCALTLR